MKLEEICWHFKISRNEEELPKNLLAVAGYVEAGCYQCDGHKTGCRYYEPLNLVKDDKI